MAKVREARLVLSANDKASGAIKKVGARLSALGKNPGILKLNAQMQRVRGSIEKLGRATAPIRKLGGVMAGLGGAAGLSVAGMVALTNSAASAAREVALLSKLSNASAGDFQRWAAGAATVGIEQDKLSDILKDVNDRVGDFMTTGGGPMADFFENIGPKVGVTIKDFQDLSGPQALQLYVSSLEKAGVSQAEMVFYMEAMASDATALIPLLKSNGKEMKRLGQEAERTGRVMSDKAIKSAEAYRKALTKMEAVTSGLANTIGATLMPIVTPMIEQLGEWVIANRELIASRVEGWVRNVARYLKQVDWRGLARDARDFARTISDMIDRVGGFRNALLILGGITMAPTIAALAGVAFQVSRLAGMALGGTVKALRAIAAMRFASAADGLASLFGAGSRKGNVAGRLNRISRAGKSIQGLKLGPVKGALMAIAGLSFGTVALGIAGVAAGVVALRSEPIQKASDAFGEMWRNLAGRDWAGARQSFQDGLSAMGDAVGRFRDTFRDMGEPFRNLVRDMTGFDLTEVGNRIRAQIGGWSEALAEFASKAIAIPGQILAAFQGTSLYQAGVDLMTSLWDGLKAVVASIVEWAKQAAEIIVAPFRGIADTIKGLVQTGQAAGANGSRTTVYPRKGTGYAGAAGDVAGRRALGGSVWKGHNYLVGERGPEIFAANQNGQIIPNDVLERIQAANSNRPPDIAALNAGNQRHLIEGGVDVGIKVDAEGRPRVVASKRGNAVRRIHLDTGPVMASGR